MVQSSMVWRSAVHDVRAARPDVGLTQAMTGLPYALTGRRRSLGADVGLWDRAAGVVGRSSRLSACPGDSFNQPFGDWWHA